MELFFSYALSFPASSVILVKVCIDVILKEYGTSSNKIGIIIGDKNLIHLLFADDEVLMTESKKDLKNVTERDSK